MKNSRKYW